MSSELSRRLVREKCCRRSADESSQDRVARRVDAHPQGAARTGEGDTRRRSPRTEPELRDVTAHSAGGFSSARLARVREVMTGYVERGEVPGLVTLVARRGQVHVDAVGTTAAGGAGLPVGRNTIFRISASTKPVTAFAP